jgi:hypothetical protein
MGFYDYRCMLSGVSLKGARATVVLLIDDAGKRHPIGLPVHGSYNRSGTIDGVRPDAASDALLAFFLGDGLTLDEAYLDGFGLLPFRTIEDAFSAVERTAADHRGAVRWEGHTVSYALMSRAVLSALAADPEAHSPDPTLERVLDPRAHLIYPQPRARFERATRELDAVLRFMRRQRIVWQAPRSPEQHGPKEMRSALRSARTKARDDAAYQAGLDAYETESADLLTE